ncbi:hypothetical protein BDN71DRAFT_1441837 [Pleurotus eryngii]|uniref:RBR-type E3 ubiquitin transferase n=1 Tax=Pleurotus eryngii TaxID=5323 RepID=A0A9P6A9P2_PLEER|nr:hypothetical protein BDN71DRAFT_1441837 [Pleurotus eryngii]
MDQEFDFPFDADVFEDLDLYIAYQLQQELDFSNIHDSPPDLEDNDSVGDEQPHWVDSDSDGGDEGGEDIINLARFAYDFDEGVDEEDADRFTHDEEEEVDDDENDQYDRQSPTPSDNSALTFSPDPSARNSPEPLARGSKAHPISLSSSEESLLQSVANPESSSGRVCPAFSCSICLDDHPEDDVALIPSCEHSFCRDCLRSYITNKVSEHRYPVFCPVCTTLADQQSPGIIDETVIEGIWIPEKEYRIFEEMQLSSLSILLHCRQCEQTMNVARDEYQENKFVICPLPACTYRWCTACQQPAPLGGPDHTCDTSTSTNLDNMVRENGWKFCPGCRALIQKESGCNHMTCITPGCNVSFCYSCGDTIVRSALVKEIYAATINHYGANCRLFEDIPDVDVPP